MENEVREHLREGLCVSDASVRAFIRSFPCLRDDPPEVLASPASIVRRELNDGLLQTLSVSAQKKHQEEGSQ